AQSEGVDTGHYWELADIQPVVDVGAAGVLEITQSDSVGSGSAEPMPQKWLRPAAFAVRLCQHPAGRIGQREHGIQLGADRCPDHLEQQFLSRPRLALLTGHVSRPLQPPREPRW